MSCIVSKIYVAVVAMQVFLFTSAPVPHHTVSSGMPGTCPSFPERQGGRAGLHDYINVGFVNECQLCVVRIPLTP